MTPEDCKYSTEHLWVKTENGGIAVIGLTDHLQERIGPVVFVDLPRPGANIRRFARLCDVETDPQACGIPQRMSFEAEFDKLSEAESETTVMELPSPVGGEVVDVNELLDESPDLTNTDAHGDGWLVRLRLSDSSELDTLLSAADYEALVG